MDTSLEPPSELEKLTLALLHSRGEVERLREREAIYSSLLGSVNAVLWAFDWEAQRIIYVSPAYETMFGRSAALLLADYNKHKLLPEDRFADYKRPAPSIPKSVGHYREWVEACKTGGPTTCHFGYAGPLTESLLLGVVANRFPETQLIWNGESMRVTNLTEANELLRRDYRDGFTVDGL